MNFNSFTANTKIESSKINENFTNIANGSKVANSAWTSYTPTWSGTGTPPSIGNGTITGKYKKIGRMVTVSIGMLVGGTTTFGTGTWTFSLPFNSVNTFPYETGAVLCLDNGTSYFVGTAKIDTATTLSCYYNTGGTIDRDTPFTWAAGSGDYLLVTLTYESTS